MNKKKLIIFSIALVLIIALVLNSVIFTGKVTSSSKDKLKIGMILPLSGQLASLGESAKNGALLSYNDLDSGQKEKISLIFEDDQFNSKNTVAAYHKLVGIDKVNAVICFTSGPCNAISPLAENDKIPLIAIASDPKVQKDKDFVFRLEIAPSEEARVLNQYLVQKNYKRIASVVAVQDGILAAYNEIKNSQSYSQKEIFYTKVKPDENDFRTIITQIMSNNPDVILVGLLPDSAGYFGRQLKEFGYRGDLIGFNFLEGEEAIANAAGGLDGIVYTNAKEPEQWFSIKYKAAYGKSY
jgi:branched-chain amino acid transport system substrate-binding protein